MEALIAVGVIVVLGIAMSFLVRKAIVANVPLLEGEEVLAQQDGLRVRVELKTTRTRELRSAFVRVTNRRVFVGTGKLSSPRRAIVSYAMDLDGDPSVGFGGGAMQDGFVTFPVARSTVAIVDGGVRLAPPEEAVSIEIPRSVTVVSAEAELVRAAIVERAKAPVGLVDRYRG